MDYALSRHECNMLRGLAIIGIFLHNFCHWLAPIVKENEYTYTQYHVDGLLQVTLHPDGNLPIHLLSFFGHYGVPVFLFLSAYGLVMKYEQDAMPTPSVWKWTRYHYLKLFKMMIVGFVAFTFIDAITPGRWHYNVIQLLAQLTMLNNLLPDPDRQIWPGPYWFFGLMLQLYIVYRLFLHRCKGSTVVVWIILFTAIQWLMVPEGESLNRYRYNFMGGMLPFGLGLLYARWIKRGMPTAVPNTATWWAGTLLTVCGIWFCSLHPILWTLVPLWVCVAGVCVVKALTGTCHLHAFNGRLAWMGDISAALFVCHPILRKVFIPISRQGDIYTGLLLYIIASICVAWLFREVMRRIPSPGMG